MILRYHFNFVLFVLCLVSLFENVNGTIMCEKRKAGRKALNDSLAISDVVLSATIRKITFDQEDGSLQSLILRIRRIFKGREYVVGKSDLNIFGIEEVECSKHLSLHSTFVFPLSVSGDHFFLAAPIFPINLSILDSLHSFSRGLPHRKRRKPKHTVCESSICPLGSKCSVLTGTCECRSNCRSSGPAVCGSDNVSYASLCHLSIRSCLLHKKGKSGLKLASHGHCSKRNPCDDLRCGPGEDCVVSQNNGVLSATCVCPASCPNYGDAVDSSPVCSTNGVDYPSLCKMKQHACSTKTNITAKYFGRCDPCDEFPCPSGTSCHLNSHRKPECRCSEQCSLKYDPVCATDGKTYSNECVMKVSSCKQEQTLEVFKRGKCEDIQTPCKNIVCSHGSECQIRNETYASCECEASCTQVMKPVCATNGLTFDNQCELRRYACEQKSRIHVKHQGTCGIGLCASYEGCTAPQVCTLIDDKPTCACPECSDELREVCGSNGRTYANECKMRREACLLDKKLFVKYNGVCDGCSTIVCEFYSVCISDGVSKPGCRCSNDCPIVKDKKAHSVCGTDGVTYSSECHLRRSACEQRKFIVVAFKGKCDACQHIECRYGEECRSGVCVCSYNCPVNPPASSKVCGENGVLYPSECHLQLAACQKGSPISVMSLSHCHSSVSTFSDSCECNRIGSIGPACDTSGQCACRAGVSGKKCDHCMPSFWGIHLIANGALSCQPCGCSAFGSARSDCEQTTGRCECKVGAFGDKCDKCGNDMIMTPSGCISKEEYLAPTDCNELKCYHGSTCVTKTEGSLPDCECPESCNSDHLGIAANMTVCGNDGITYENFCQLQQFACKHQLDLVVRSLGICDEEIEVIDRFERNKETAVRLGSYCTMPSDCAEINAVCKLRAGKRGTCACPRSSKMTKEGHCEIFNSQNITNIFIDLNGRNGYHVNIDMLDLFFNFTIDVNPRVSNGLILFGEGEEGANFILRLENRRFVVEIGDDLLHSREYVPLNSNSSLSLIWKNKFATLKTSKSSVSMRIGTKNQKLKNLWIGSNTLQYGRPNEGAVSRLLINHEVISQDDIIPYDVAAGKASHPFIHPVSFGEQGGFVEFNEVDIDARTKAHIEIRLKPMKANGLLFFWTSKEKKNLDEGFIVIALINFVPHMYWRNGPKTHELSGSKLKGQEYNTIMFSYNSKSRSIIVNGEKTEIDEPVETQSMNPLGKTMYVGGAPDESHSTVNAIDNKKNLAHDLILSRLRDSLSVTNIEHFEGWIYWMTINEQILDFRTAKTHGDISEDVRCTASCDFGETCYQRGNNQQCRGTDLTSISLDGKEEYGYANGGDKFLTSTNSSKFSFEFKSQTTTGILWWESTWSQRDDGDFFVIYLAKGKLKMGLNLGNDLKFRPVVLKESIEIGKWYTIEVDRLDRRIRVQVAKEKELTIVTTPGSTELNTNGVIYIGGRKTSKKSVPLQTMFIGCLRNLVVNSKPVNLLHDSISDVKPSTCRS
ncbi:unnamed protein product [Auanema sp. JU1783]|nr:unnamed protein product [Auanema sp. JU1783]